jgi:uncharacterized protein
LINWKVIKRLQWLYPPTAVKFFKNISEELCNRVEYLTHCLANESCTDDLTGICNRRGFCQILESELRRAVRYQEPPGFCLIEINFNETTSGKGNNTPREILGQLVQSWCTVIRDCDILGRIDAKRFIVLLPKTPDGQIDGVTKRLQATSKKILSDYGPATFTFKSTTFNFPMDKVPDGEQVMVDALKRMGVNDSPDPEPDPTCELLPIT